MQFNSFIAPTLVSKVTLEALGRALAAEAVAMWGGIMVQVADWLGSIS